MCVCLCVYDICVCIYVCMYIYIYIYIYMSSIHKHIHISIYTAYEYTCYIWGITPLFDSPKAPSLFRGLRLVQQLGVMCSPTN